MDAEELQDRIAAFPRWHYRFEFANGVSTPMPDRQMANRHEQRRGYFFDPLVRVLGGSLSGRRVLDLGCNAGLWSLLALEAGADFVLGIDAQEMFVEQARLVLEAKELDPARYRLDVGNVFDYDFVESFDVVLCLGLLAHTAKPVELFELMAGVGAEIIVIDTEIARARASLFEVSNVPGREHVLDHTLVLIPSRAAVSELAAEFGFATVALAQNISDYAGMKDYRAQLRLAFICSKGGSLQGLAAEARAPLVPWWMTAAVNARKAR